MKEEFLTRDDRLLKSMMFNIYSVIQHESGKSAGSSTAKRRKSLFGTLPKEKKLGITRHHNVMLELDNIKSSNPQHL